MSILANEVKKSENTASVLYVVQDLSNKIARLLVWSISEFTLQIFENCLTP